MRPRSLLDAPRGDGDAGDERDRVVRQAFERTAGSPLTEGNDVRLLIDAEENFPAWREAIESAERNVHLEMYIIRDDEAGRAIAELLARKAREGVRVRVLYDWWGALNSTVLGFWRRLRASGVEVRSCNPPRLSNALSWASRDHRKLLVVDGRVGFVSGLCVGQDWIGFPDRGIPPWRDTGVEIRGPAVGELERAFAEMWPGAMDPVEDVEPAVSVRPTEGLAVGVVATSPEMTRVLRLDLFWAAIARERLWLADAYFMPISAYLGALQSAAWDGVDVRLLVPSASDVQLVAAFSRTQYRPLLEAGVRVFEWKGSMMHAKTAVVDGLWSRIGSSNLNIASWTGNWELDVSIENAEFGERMEDVYLDDLENATEIVLDPRHRVQPAVREPRPPKKKKRAVGSAGRAAVAAMRLGKSFGAALTERGVAQGEARAFAGFGLALLLLALVAVLWPKVLSYAAAVVAGYTGIALLLRALRVWRSRRRQRSRRESNET